MCGLLVYENEFCFKNTLSEKKVQNSHWGGTLGYKS